MKPVIFLDIDGVLNCHENLHPEVMCGTFHRDKVDLLNSILRKTGAKIVLSSAWRYLVHRNEMNVIGMEWLMRSHGVLHGRLIGVTRQDTMERAPWDGFSEWKPCDNERGKQITEWINFHADVGFRYVVIDDLDLGISAECHPFVKTDGKVGLTKDDAIKAMEILTR